jgi:hypothetical protein
MKLIKEYAGGGNTWILVGELTALFTYLKLTNQADWAWVWVLSPIWICAGSIILIRPTIRLLYSLRAWWATK